MVLSQKFFLLANLSFLSQDLPRSLQHITFVTNLSHHCAIAHSLPLTHNIPVLSTKFN